MKTLLLLILITVTGHNAVFSETLYLYLKARCHQDSCIVVDWVTAAEINNDGFGVWRSTDGVNFAEIAWADGFGNSSVAHSYSIIDCNALPGTTYYYRLKQVDFDKRTELTYIVYAVVSDSTCNPTAITEPPGANESSAIIIQPNPISHRGKIMFENTNHEYLKCALLDISGKEIKSFETFENEIEITKGHINPGRYFIKLIDARGLTKGVGSFIFK